MIQKLLLVLSLCFSLWAEIELAEPLPSMFEKRQIIFSINSDNEKKIHSLLSTINNLLKFYRPENVQIRVVAYSGGITMLLHKNKDIQRRVSALQQIEVEFVACGNTMKTKKIKQSDLMEDVEIASAGIAEVVEKSVAGWTNITIP